MTCAGGEQLGHWAGTALSHLPGCGGLWPERWPLPAVLEPPLCAACCCCLLPATWSPDQKQQLRWRSMMNKRRQGAMMRCGLSRADAGGAAATSICNMPPLHAADKLDKESRFRCGESWVSVCFSTLVTKYNLHLTSLMKHGLHFGHLVMTLCTS